MEETINRLSENETLTSANAVVLAEKLKSKIMPGYTEMLKKTFDGETICTENFVKAVNDWVSEKTKGMIEKVLDENNDEMLAVFINAVAFEDKWKLEYKDNDIVEEETFHNANGTTVETDMLYSSEWKYIENKYFTGTIKPYKNEDYSLMLLLPKKENSSVFIR